MLSLVPQQPENCNESLLVLTTQLERHGFKIRRHTEGDIHNEFGRIVTPLFILEGGAFESARLTDLIIEFYNERPVPEMDTTLTALLDLSLFDREIDDRLEFEFTTVGADLLIKLPPELKAAVTVIRQTAQRVRTASANPNRRAAVAEARQAVGEMVDFVKQQTALVRAVDPDTQALLQQTGQAMTQALNELDLQLVSAVEI